MQACNTRWAILKSTLQNLSPTEFAVALKSQSDVILLDCRTPAEYQNGHLKGAINFDYLSREFVENMESLDPEATYLAYCQSERRSIRTCVLLKNGGFKNIVNLDGGLNNWVAEFGEKDIFK